MGTGKPLQGQELADEIERLLCIINPPQPSRKCSTCNDDKIITDCFGRESPCPDCSA